MNGCDVLLDHSLIMWQILPFFTEGVCAEREMDPAGGRRDFFRGRGAGARVRRAIGVREKGRARAARQAHRAAAVRKHGHDDRLEARRHDVAASSWLRFRLGFGDAIHVSGA